MKVYLSAPYAARDRVRLAAEALSAEGHTITSSWIYATHDIRPEVLDAAPGQSDEYVQDRVAADLADIDASDVVVLFSSRWAVRRWGLSVEQTTSGGRHIETGYAIAKGKWVIVVGPPENIFHRTCTTVLNFPGVIRVLSRIERGSF